MYSCMYVTIVFQICVKLLDAILHPSVLICNVLFSGMHLYMIAYLKKLNLEPLYTRTVYQILLFRCNKRAFSKFFHLLTLSV